MGQFICGDKVVNGLVYKAVLVGEATFAKLKLNVSKKKFLFVINFFQFFASILFKLAHYFK